MAKPSRLKKEGGYWKAFVAGRKRSFGNVNKVTLIEAQQAYARAIQDVPQPGTPASRVKKRFSVAELIDDYLIWLADHTGKSNYTTKKSLLKNFVAWESPRLRRQVAGVRAVDLVPSDFQDYIDYRRKRVGPGTLWHDFKALSACWTWGAGCKGHPTSHLPADHRPFDQLKCPPKPKKELTGDMLMTRDEYQSLLKNGETYGLHDLFKVMYETGCRPGELAAALVRDFDAEGAQLVLYKHKNRDRSASAKPRRIYLPPQALEIVDRLCRGRSPGDPIFVGPLGAAWDANRIGKLFREIRPREDLTPYSFRDAFISEMLRIGKPIFNVAAMVGTSPKMIQDHYGHFFQDDLASAAAELSAARAVPPTASTDTPAPAPITPTVDAPPTWGLSTFSVSTLG